MYSLLLQLFNWYHMLFTTHCKDFVPSTLFFTHCAYVVLSALSFVTCSLLQNFGRVLCTLFIVHCILCSNLYHSLDSKLYGFLSLNSLHCTLRFALSFPVCASSVPFSLLYTYCVLFSPLAALYIRFVLSFSLCVISAHALLSTLHSALRCIVYTQKNTLRALLASLSPFHEVCTEFCSGLCSELSTPTGYCMSMLCSLLYALLTLPTDHCLFRFALRVCCSLHFPRCPFYTLSFLLYALSAFCVIVGTLRYGHVHRKPWVFSALLSPLYYAYSVEVILIAQ